MTVKKLWKVAVAVLVFALLGGGIWYQGVQKKNASDSETEDAEEKKGQADVGTDNIVLVQKVNFPEKKRRESVDKVYLENLLPFYESSVRNLLLSQKGKNCVYSPVNLYLSMAMLTEMTDGKTRRQLLDALGQKDVEEIRKQSQSIWKSVYTDRAGSECILGNSIWLNQDISFQKEVLKTLAEHYYTETYQGAMGTGMDRQIQEWVNEMTRNTLEKEAEDITTDAEKTVFVLMSTAYFDDQWVEPFDSSSTRKDIFTNADGKEIECDFMNRTEKGGVYKAKRFQSTWLEFEGGSNMFLFLPEKGVSLEEVLKKDMEEILHISASFGIGFEEGGVALSLPKFAISSNLDLIPAMKTMGIEDLFDQSTADFTKLLGKEKENRFPVYVSKVRQASKATVDEAGCYVASFTETELLAGAAGFGKIFEIDCDRPFLFIISDGNGIPVFAGTVNQIKE